MMMRVENETPRKRKHSQSLSDSSLSAEEIQKTPSKSNPASDGRTKKFVKSTPVKKITLEETILDTYGEEEQAARIHFERTFYERSLTDEFMAQKPTTSSSEYNAAGSTQENAVESGYDADESQVSEANCSQTEEDKND
ncbi:hypothetical protein L5515_016328 [Caenorhabditis briggsae]|uniref:Uncharacterized protein n=1 Tax=Caenorhabditis briggsae TaxID=6238 RepID=A0AAE9FAV5_CAEBR|nr:hypothetical protein L5515_016328 [Caenorhabditis briggsae]